MDNGAAVKYLESLLNRTLRAHTSDGRMFLGEFKCTDNVLTDSSRVRGYHIDDFQESNIILAKTYEYRMPTAKAKEAIESEQANQGVHKADMTSRFLGLVVVPGQHITKLEVEEKKPWELPLRPG